jgi:hypothetical protein
LRHRTKTFRWVVLLSLLAAVLVAAGCGGSGSSSGDARTTLDKAFKTPITSANISIELQARVQGVPQLQGPASLKIAGPYQSNGKGKLPSLNWQISGSAAGQALNAGFISTGDNAFVGFQGQNYELGKAQVAKINQQQGQKRSLKQFGIDPQNWVTSPQAKSDETVNGADTKHVSGGLDIGKMLTDLSTGVQKAGALSGRSSQTPQLTPTQVAAVKKYVTNPKFDVFVGKSDNKIRRLSVAVDFQVPQGQQSKASGLKGGTFTLKVDFSNVGQRQTISAPANAKPLKDLQSALGGLGTGALGR